MGAAGGVEPVVGGRPDAERLERRDRAVGVAAGDLVEAVAKPKGPTRVPATASAGEHDDRQQRRRPQQEAQQRPRRQRPPHRRQGQAPEGDDRDRPGEPGEAVGEEDAAGQRQAAAARPASAPRRSRPSAAEGTLRPSAVDVEQADGEGEDEERLGGLLEGGLGEVGGGRGRERRPASRRAARRAGAEARAAPPSAVSAGEDADREDLADEGLAEADPRHRRGRDREAVRAERVAGVGRRPEAAAQPLGPGQVQAEVVVEADPEQAPAAADRERDREHQGDDERHRQPCAQRPAGAS